MLALLRLLAAARLLLIGGRLHKLSPVRLPIVVRDLLGMHSTAEGTDGGRFVHAVAGSFASHGRELLAGGNGFTAVAPGPALVTPASALLTSVALAVLAQAGLLLIILLVFISPGNITLALARSLDCPLQSSLLVGDVKRHLTISL